MAWQGRLLVFLAQFLGVVSVPHIVFLLTDDLGYNSPGYRNSDLRTPTLDALAAGGLKLDAVYTFMYCAPSRGSFLTGRLPYRLNAVEKNLIPWDMPVGTNLTYTMLPKKLKQAGYVSHHIGKWHQGFFTSEYTPQGRGFDTTFGFLVGGEDHYTQDASWSVNCKVVDLWDNGSPAIGRTGHNKSDDDHYNAYTFTRRAVHLIEGHADRFGANGKPFFLYFALHNTHGPVEAPTRFTSMYNFSQDLRNRFNGMISVVDESTRNVTDALKRTGMWDNTLLVWCTDNGSPVTVAGSNEPLRGGKGSNWEGGTRVPAFVTGGVLPAEMVGRTLDGVAHLADFYATFSVIAGLPPGDPSTTAPVPSDSLNLWPWLSGQAAHSPRTELVYDHRRVEVNGTHTYHGALRVGDWKLMVGPQKQASWYGHFTPNVTGHPPSVAFTACSEQPCLFNVQEDPTEHKDCSTSEPQALASLLNRWEELKTEFHPPPNPPRQSKEFCAHAAATHGFVSPWH